LLCELNDDNIIPVPTPTLDEDTSVPEV